MIICILRHKPIVSILARNLSIESLMQLASTNRFMYTDWSDSADIIDATKIKDLIYMRFGWNWNLVVESPFKVLRKHMFESRLPFSVLPKTFLCVGGCGHTRPSTVLSSHKFAKYAICYNCLKLPDGWIKSYEEFEIRHQNEIADQLWQPRWKLKKVDPFSRPSIIDRHYNPQIKEHSWIVKICEFGPRFPFVVHVDDIKKRAAADIETFEMRDWRQLEKYFG